MLQKKCPKKEILMDYISRSCDFLKKEIITKKGNFDCLNFESGDTFLHNFPFLEITKKGNNY